MAAHACTFAIAWSLAAQAFASPGTETTETARGIALGTGGAAGAASTSALAYDPAGLPSARLYHVEALAAHEAESGRWSLGAAVADSATNRLAAGLSLRGIFGDGETGYSGVDGRLGIGVPVTGMVAIGVAGRYLSLTRDGAGPLGEAPDSSLVKGFTMDGSLRATPTQTLSLSFLAYNILELESELVPVELGGSVAFRAGTVFAAAADCLFDMSTYDKPMARIGGGAELLVGGAVPLRGGYAYDRGARRHYVTGGAGYMTEKLGLEVSIRRMLGSHATTEIFASLRFFVGDAASTQYE